MARDTVSTNIKGLDELLGGGIPKGATVLINGPPGAGKTVMSLQYALSQARNGERVLFVSTCEPIYKINKFASSLSFYDLDLISGGINMDFYDARVKKGYVEFQDYSLGQMTDEQYVGDFFEGIQKKVARRSIDHLVIDSITSINMLLGDEIERRKKILLFSAWVSRMGCTTLLTSEYEKGTAGSRTERFLADAVIDLEKPGGIAIASRKEPASYICRTIEVVKLRGKRHMPGKYLYNITNDGITILLPGIKPLSGDRRGAMTGIQDLDDIIGGIVYGEIWHFDSMDPWIFKPFLSAMMRDAISSSDGIIWFTSPDYRPSTLESLKAYFGKDVEKAVLEGRMVAMDCHGVPVSGEIKDAFVRVAIESGDVEPALMHSIMSVTGAGDRKWRIFMNLRELRDCFGEKMAMRIYFEIAGLVRSGKGILVTFIDIADSRRELAEYVDHYSHGCIDIWNAGGYVFLQVKKAPSAKIFEPLIVKEENGKILLLTL